MDKHLTIRLPKRLIRAALVLMLAAVVIAPVAVSASHVFDDVDDSNTFHDDIAWLADAGVTLGCNPPTNNNYCPDNAVTRAQMSAFMRRLAENKVVDAATAEDAEMLDGMDSTDFAASAHTHDKASITDEPGIAVATPANFTNLTGLNTFDQIGSVEISTPGAGYVVVQAFGYINLDHTNGTFDNVGVNLHDSATAPGTVFYEGASSFVVDSPLPTASHRYPFSTQSVYEVAGAETLTVYLYANQFSGATPTTTNVAHPQIIATYYPTAYGTVSPAVAPAAGADGFAE